MKRSLLATSIALPVAGIIGGVGLNCGNTAAPYVAPDSGGGSSSGSSSGSSGSSSGSASGSSSGVSSGSSSGGGSSGGVSEAGSGAAASGSNSGDAGGSGSDSGGSPEGGTATLASIFGIPNGYHETFMDSFILFPCYSNQQQDCITNPPGTACPHFNDMTLPYEQRGIQFHNYFQLGGTVGQMYKMTIHVEGITEAKYYMGGTCVPNNPDQPKCAAGRADGLADPTNANTLDITVASDTFYTGGAPVDFEFYNIYKLVVHNPAPAGATIDPGSGVATNGPELQHYYLNSFPKTNIPYEDHVTYFVNFTHTIPVPGGGVIEYHLGDTNCHAIDNCGVGRFTATCAANAGRSIPNITIPATTMGLKVAANGLGMGVGINQRNGTSQPFHSHVFHVTVTAFQ